MKIFENIINHKINNISTAELLKYGEQFQISVTRQQAAKIAEYLRGKNINIFDDAERTKVVKQIAKITNPETARQINQLFIKLTK